MWPGRNWPLGATWSPESTNFAVHAPRATAAWVCLLSPLAAKYARSLQAQERSKQRMKLVDRDGIVAPIGKQVPAIKLIE